ncbi:unnamed protein product [Rodentolepis nana]|uniref:Uncharacterized protein n=1 Tax=Rodentolepis nana TaxID=102285 RepID=A0A158QHN0_RODNA|nr:unnamed protein product [Rodentolepis nana]
MSPSATRLNSATAPILGQSGMSESATVDRFSLVRALMSKTTTEKATTNDLPIPTQSSNEGEQKEPEENDERDEGKSKEEKRVDKPSTEVPTTESLPIATQESAKEETNKPEESEEKEEEEEEGKKEQNGDGETQKNQS